MPNGNEYADHLTGAGRDTGVTAQQEHDRYTAALAATTGVGDTGSAPAQAPIDPRRDGLDALYRRQGE